MIVATASHVIISIPIIMAAIAISIAVTRTPAQPAEITGEDKIIVYPGA
jgi:hypothetical protein